MAESIHPNSARYWLPRIQETELVSLIPKTFTVPYDHASAVAAIEDGVEWSDWGPLQDMVWDNVESFGTAAFVRTDLSSAKHDGPDSYKITTRDDVMRVLSFTIQDNEMKFWPTGPWPTCFLVREWLDLPAPFTAFGGHPIAREWRYFATAEGVQCRHFYWPEHAIENYVNVEGWQQQLADMATEKPPVELDELAAKAAAACPAAEQWSVDFAYDVTGRWNLIDMATAESSWHPTHDV